MTYFVVKRYILGLFSCPSVDINQSQYGWLGFSPGLRHFTLKLNIRQYVLHVFSSLLINMDILLNLHSFTLRIMLKGAVTLIFAYFCHSMYNKGMDEKAFQ